jgi:hypothetical protein
MPGSRTVAWHSPREAAAETRIEAASAAQAGFRPKHPALAVDNQPLPPPILRNLSGGIPVVFQPSDLSPTLHMQLVLAGTNFAGSGTISGTPADGFTSLAIQRRSRDLETTIDELRELLQNVRRVPGGGEPDSTDPETRLEQVLGHHMTMASKLQDAATVPALIVVSGHAKEDEVFPLLERAFGELPAQSFTAPPSELVDSGEQTVNLGTPVAQAQLGYIVSAPGPGNRASDATRLLQYILAHGYEGRLGKEVISRRGLAYYIDSRYRSDGTNGWVTLGIGVDPQKVDSLKALLSSELRRLQDEPPSPAEVDEARNYFLGRARSAAQSNEELADELARQWLWYGDTLAAESLRRRLADVSYRDVLNAVPVFINGRTIVITE